MAPVNSEDFKRLLVESGKTSSAQSEIWYPHAQESRSCGTATLRHRSILMHAYKAIFFRAAIVHQVSVLEVPSHLNP
jgi:hypothetical protein